MALCDSVVQLTSYLDPYYVHIDDAVVRIFITALIGFILAYGAYRARRLMVEQAEVVRERANLARYLAPNMVDALARIDRPMGETRTHDVAVLFADIKGFTALAEAGSPADTMQSFARLSRKDGSLCLRPWRHARQVPR